MPVNGLEQTHIQELAEKLAPLGYALKMPDRDNGQGTRVSIIRKSDNTVVAGLQQIANSPGPNARCWYYQDSKGRKSAQVGFIADLEPLVLADLSVP